MWERGMALLAWKLDSRGTVVGEVVVLGSGVVGGSSGVYRGLKGGRNSKYTASITTIERHDNAMLTVALTLYKVRCSEREFIRGRIPAPVITGQGLTGGGIMPEVSWTSDTREGDVSGVVEVFRTTFVFEII